MPTTDTTYTTSERAFAIGFRLSRGEVLPTKRVANEYGMTYSGARRLMLRVSRVAPVIEDSNGWRIISSRGL